MAMKEINAFVGALLIVEVPGLEKRLSVHIGVGNVKVENDKCKHRGGPLHLSYRDEQNFLRCPWHDRRVSRSTKCDDISVTYYASRQVLRLISSHSADLPWPVSFVSPTSS